ncbi:hypothetical protein BSL78_25705 [Apostichopus japonicus]|uniref:Cysteine dioxygenase n=1 Tax=Stichopus japonicus TaxID=307972 RepID=A0A2G8JNV9_STIJA|nr:hypothetical protein BSL78_25705 [Apostichopus japonicus]
MARQHTCDKATRYGSPVWEKTFPVLGKGTLLFNIKRDKPFYIAVCNKEGDENAETTILLEVDEHGASFCTQQRPLVSSTNHTGYEPLKIVTYWYSYDSDNMTVKYGKGYCMEETTLLKYTFTDKSDRVKYFDPAKRRVVKLFNSNPLVSHRSSWRSKMNKLLKGSTEPSDTLVDVEKKIMFSPYPLMCNRPPFVRDSSLSNMMDIDLGEITYSSSLPEACQDLYDNVKGDDMSLDYGEKEYTLTDAIRHSIEDENGLLHKTLEKKKNEFGSHDQIYLRITLGKNFGNSPGIPYVLEIWPKKCGSPIHGHGNSCAVIRVLHGGLTISIYNKNTTDEMAKPLKEFDVKKDDVTWIAPNWYQTHKLWNKQMTSVRLFSVISMEIKTTYIGHSSTTSIQNPIQLMYLCQIQISISKKCTIK